MLSRYFSSYTGQNSKKKWEKEISLVVQDKKNDENHTFKVSKRLLMDHSLVFRDMPQAELKKCGKIVLEDVTVVALKNIVEYMQKASVKFINHSDVLETLKVAERYRMISMVDICVNNLITVLDPANVCDIYEVASALSSNYLIYFCLKLIDKHAEEVLKSRGFATLKKPTVLDIIRRNSLQVNSELTVFQAVLGWGLNICLRQGGDPNDTERFLPIVKYLFNYVRFNFMSEEELRDPEVGKYQNFMTHQTESLCRDRAMSTTSQSSSVSVELEKQPRQFAMDYTHQLDVFESNNQPTVKSGEVFCLSVEVLKGKVFITSLNLAFKPFAATKKAVCLYVVLTATNSSTTEHRTVRGTFSQTADEASLVFVNPLPAKQSDKLRISLSVKRAENVCPFIIQRDVQIAMPESKAVALKITPLLSTCETEGMERCIFRELKYFY